MKQNCQYRMHTSLKSCFIIIFISLVAASCKKENSPEKSTTGHGDVSYFAKASGQGVKVASAKANNISSEQVVVDWSSASVYVEKISFVGKNGNLLDTTVIVGKNIDLFSADALAGVIQLPVGSYKDVKVKLFLLKSQNSKMAFDLKGTFVNTEGKRDSIMVGSSFPFEANLSVTDITVNAADKYNATFNFNLDKVLTGISTSLLQTARSYVSPNNNDRMYVIWKGGSDDEPFYDQVIANWQTLASVTITKK